MAASASTITVSAARAALPDLLDRVILGEEVTITRHGVPVAVMVRVDSLRTRRAESALARSREITDLLAQSRINGVRRQPRMTAARGDELVAEVRADRER